MNRGNDRPAVHFLLSLIEQEDAAVVRHRLGIGEPEQLTADVAGKWLDGLRPPKSALLWMLEEDDPAINQVVFHYADTLDVTRRDILRGVPFGGARGVLPTLVRAEEPQVLVSPRGVVAGLREARTIKTARSAARVVGQQDWAVLAEADLDEPLPGYARWALTERADCPGEVRAQFGSHVKFTRRVREAGVVEPAEYAEQTKPARQVLGVLHFGRQLFPRRTREAAAVLAPLVRDEIGVDPDSWAVMAQLLPTFLGTVAELVHTSAAVAHAGR
ncbi:hypothetical protein JNUCC0626_16325 [Lentzea sp. JNUCC 0626]|uniref:hypothetical protein n=1 Tax=Lentzea sp. JNUCC 0626 TaxID=3367513 RepID=UPI0037478F49